MASTYRPIDALDVAKRYIKNMPLEEVGVRVLDDANKYLWMAAPWRWTISSLSSTIPLVSQTVDYTLAPPNNFLKPIFAYIADGSTTNQYLQIAPSLPANMTQRGVPTRIAYMGSNSWRVYPKPIVPANQEVVIMYKKKSPIITNQTSYTAGFLELDDEWFWVYQQAVLWKAYLYADDQKAGNTQIDSKQTYQLSQARAELEVSIQLMKERELLPIFNYQTVPDPVAGSK